LKRFAVCLALLASIAIAEPSSTTLPGVYWLPEKDGQMQVYQKDDTYFGRVISYDVAGQLDEKNPNPEFRSRPIVGVDLLSEFSYDEASERWVGGTIYDAKSGKTYKCRLWFEDDEPGVLWARGYIGISLLGRTERFERVKE
jgi:uncharacterized protein (DUF2147 family)